MGMGPLTWALLLAVGPAACDEPLNIAVGGVRLAPATADLLGRYEQPRPPGMLSDALESVRLLTTIKDPVEGLLPAVLPGTPAGVQENRHRNSEYLAQGLGEGFEPLRWESVFTKGSERDQAISSLSEMLRIRHAENPDRDINVVCHSHGCGIALEAFEQVESEGVRVGKFVSLGTRLTGLPGDNRRDKPKNVGEWVNIHSRHDQALSKSLEGEGILNAEFTGGDSQPHLGVFSGHGLYYQNEDVRGALVDMLKGTDPAESVLRERHAGVLELPKEPDAPAVER